MMKLNRRVLNESGVAHLLLLVVVVVVAIGGVGTLVAVRQSKSQKDSKSVAQTANQQQEVKTDQTAQKAEETPVATPPTAQTPPETQAQAAPKPAAPKITHPTDATCPTGKTLTVYASVSGGTPVYTQNYADPQQVAKKAAYGSSITASCYGGGWMEYRVGNQPYYVNHADVSITKP